MANISLSVYDVIHTSYNQDGHKYNYSVSNSFKPSPEHTYFIVFNYAQLGEQEHFEKTFGDKVIFKSKQAFNKRYPNSGPRNTLYIFEI